MPGKFERNSDPKLAEYLYGLTLEGRQDAEAGDVNQYGFWVALLLNVPGKGRMQSYTLTESDTGFVFYCVHSTVTAAKDTWQRITRQLERDSQNTQDI